jgi:hypothetical protein
MKYPIWVGAKRPGRPWLIRTYESWWEGDERKHQVAVMNSAVAFFPAPNKRHPWPAHNPQRAERPVGLSGRKWVRLRRARRRGQAERLRTWESR